MDKKSKIFFAVFFLLIALSVGATYYRYVVVHDYMIQAEADCDPYAESCFIYACDPEADEECTGDPKEDTSYYKLIDRNAKNIPLCDLADETCDVLVCGESEADCSYTLCDETTATNGETCNDPVTYTLENPIEAENSTDEEDTVTGEEAETDSTESDGESSIPTRESLVLLDKVSCKTGNTFVSTDTSNKIPVDADGNYETTFSADKAQLVSLTDAQGELCAYGISFPGYAGRIYVDAKSTAIASVFRTEGIATTVPEEATRRLVMIEESVFFPDFLAYVETTLPEKNIATLTAQPEFQNLVKKCAEEVISKLLP